MARKKKSPEALIADLIEAGEWPDPKLLREIVAHGVAAVPFVVTRLRQQIDQPTATLPHLLGLLTLLPGGAAVPELLRLLELGRTEELLAWAIVAQGPAAVEPLMLLLKNERLPWYDRGLAAQLALSCAREVEPVCIVLRELLRVLLGRKKKLSPEERSLVGSLVLDLAQVPDRAAESLLREAVRAKLCDFTNERELESLLTAPPPGLAEPLDWIEEYRERYDEREDEN